jgi:hypothetical protein
MGLLLRCIRLHIYLFRRRRGTFSLPKLEL